jgi:hypothetical protein
VLFVKKKYKNSTFYAILLPIPLHNSLSYQLSHDPLLMSELNTSGLFYPFGSSNNRKMKEEVVGRDRT